MKYVFIVALVVVIYHTGSIRHFIADQLAAASVWVRPTRPLQIWY